LGFLEKNQKIKARIFFEVMGWPPEELKNHLQKLVEKLKTQWKLSDVKLEEPVKVEDVEKMHVAHVEFIAEVKSLGELMLFSLLNGPSLVEILEPSEIYLSAGEVQDIIADIISKGQALDRDLKVLSANYKLVKDELDRLKMKSKEEDIDKVTI